MGLDIHVMRPKRFFMRDFSLPVQRLLPDMEIQLIGVNPMTASDAEITEQLLIRTLRINQHNQQSNPYALPAHDEVAFSERFSYQAFDLLREFAAYLDYPPKQYVFWGAHAFGEGYSIDKLPSLKSAWKTQRSTYPHLVFHEDNRGCYFPTNFHLPVPSEFGYLGSVYHLREELIRVSTRVQQALRHREAVKEAIELLLRAADCAEQSHLPIIFDG